MEDKRLNRAMELKKQIRETDAIIEKLRHHKGCAYINVLTRFDTVPLLVLDEEMKEIIVEELARRTAAAVRELKRL